VSVTETQEKNGHLLLMQGICKAYPGVQALKEVNFEVRAGEVHALVGENGAGKSTLVKIITGAVQPDRGEIVFKGSELERLDPRFSRDLGIGVTYQEINLVGALSVAENVLFGHFPARGGLLDWRRLNEEAARLLQELNLDIDPTTLVEDLSVGQQQLVEIARAAFLTRELIIMDEPTSALSEQETEVLFSLIERLKDRGTSVIYVSHRLEEVLRIADRITVLRDGEYVGTLERAQATQDAIIHMMVGREISDLFPKQDATIGEPVLEVRNLSRRGAFHDINFSLRKGEIVGLFGLLGSGRTETAHAIFGLDHIDEGEIFLDGEKVEISSPAKAIGHGLGFVPEDRKTLGVVLRFNVRENISLPSLGALTQLGLISSRKERELARHMVEQLDIRTPSLDQKVVNLSGGNQQKVVIAKWLARESNVLIVDEPTRGIDVATKAQVHALMSQLAQEGVGVLMISSELPEVLAMSDRILVLHEGRITGEFSRNNATSEAIMRCATGDDSALANCTLAQASTSTQEATQ
jgi:ribose transport system ATP-binding protein